MYIPWLANYCKLQDTSPEVDWGVCEKVMHQLILDILMGNVPHKKINDEKIIEYARTSPVHALSIASKLADTTNNYIILTILDNNYSGVIFVVSPPSSNVQTNGAFRRSDIIMCNIESGIYVDCNRPSVLSSWPNNNTNIKIYEIKKSDMERFIKDIVKYVINST